jgi:hypothetical protein
MGNHRLETLSSFTLAWMLSDCAEGSATQRAIQKELRSREVNKKDNGTLPLPLGWLSKKREEEEGGREEE